MIILFTSLTFAAALGYWLARPSLWTPGERIRRAVTSIPPTALYHALRRRL